VSTTVDTNCTPACCGKSEPGPGTSCCCFATSPCPAKNDERGTTRGQSTSARSCELRLRCGRRAELPHGTGPTQPRTHSRQRAIFSAGDGLKTAASTPDRVFADHKPPHRFCQNLAQSDSDGWPSRIEMATCLRRSACCPTDLQASGTVGSARRGRESSTGLRDAYRIGLAGYSLVPHWETSLSDRRVFSTGIGEEEEREAVIFDEFKYVQFVGTDHRELYDPRSTLASTKTPRGTSLSLSRSAACSYMSIVQKLKFCAKRTEWRTRKRERWMRSLLDVCGLSAV